MLIISDRVKESSTTEGVGSIIFEAPFGSFQSFQQGVGDGNATYYCVENGTRWEVGQGTYNQSSNSLSRDVVFDSSVGGSKITLEGPSVVFCTLPADKAIVRDEDGGAYVASISTINANASGLSSNTLSVSGVASFAQDVTVSGNVSMLGNLLYDGDLNVNSVNIAEGVRSSGLLVLVRPQGDAGNLLHAYKEDGVRQTLALHLDDQVSPLWKFGLKTNPTSDTAAPTFAYSFARDGSAGMVSNLDNYFSVSDSIGFTTVHGANTVLRASSLTGVYLETTSSAYPSLVVTAPSLATAPIQEWRGSDDTVLSVVDSGGKIGVFLENPEYDIDVNGSGRMETICLTNGIHFPDGTFQNTASVSGSGGGASTSRNYTSISSDYSVPSSGDIIFTDSTSNPINVYIPTAIPFGGKEILIKRVAGENLVTVIASGSEKIDGQSSITMFHLYESINLFSDNSNWFIT